MGYYSPEDIERQAIDINEKYNYGELYIKSLCYIYEQFNWSPHEMDEYHQPYSEKWWPEWVADFEIYDRQSEEQWKSMIDDYFDVYSRADSRRKRIWSHLLGSDPATIVGPHFVFRIVSNPTTGVPNSWLIAEGELEVIAQNDRFKDRYGNIWRWLPAGSVSGPAPFQLPDGTWINQDPMPVPDGSPTMVYDNSNDPNIAIRWMTPPDFSRIIRVQYVFPDGPPYDT